ncbi:hypothetical protein [Chryseobacterium indoltheticum]|uniref:hypothetical protein n=1 Tax=Chryseobacterium indoltheticum TaxID=254 RepID=UPI003F4975D5
MGKSILIFIIFLVGIFSVNAQEKVVVDSSQSYSSYDCGLVQTKQKLDKKQFAKAQRRCVLELIIAIISMQRFSYREKKG